MLEARAFVTELDTARSILQNAQALFKGEYRCRDVIFVSTDPHTTLSDAFLRLRVNEKNIWDEKDVIVAIKQTKQKKIGKDAIIPIREEFDTEAEAREYIQSNFADAYKEDFEFTRTGWQYDMGKDQVDLERLENLQDCYTIEMKSETEEGLEHLADLFELTETIQGPMVVVMREKIKK